MSTDNTLVLPKWYDLHAHFRQGEAVAWYVRDHLAMGCAGALAMPNTRPPVSRVTGENTADFWTVEGYSRLLLDAGAEEFDQLIVPLYLTRDTTAGMIEAGARSGWLRACKYYPPHGTTNSEHGWPLEDMVNGDVLKAMQDHGVVLCLHGEQHGLSGSAYFDESGTAEATFYGGIMRGIPERFPELKMVCEHITTEEAVRFVSEAPDTVGATITPQHLLYTIGDLIQGLKYHLYCLPIVKFEADRASLREAVLQPGQRKFFAGTDSAPHSHKVTECGCAAGCYTGACAPQLYAMAFEEAGADLFAVEGREALERFLCLNGPQHYGFPPSGESFVMVRRPSASVPLVTGEGTVVPLPCGLGVTLEWEVTGFQSPVVPRACAI